jgi:hypothetical protein
MTALLLTIAAFAAAPPVAVVESAWMRVEVDTALGAIRYLGAKEGVNFVEPLHVRKSDLRQQLPIDPGGLGWQLIADEAMPDISGRPLVVVAQSPLHLSLRPMNPDGALPDLRIDIRLSESEPTGAMEVAIGGGAALEAPAALRVLCRVAPSADIVPAEGAPGRSRPLYPGVAALASDAIRPATLQTYEAGELGIRRSGYTLTRQWTPDSRTRLHLVQDAYTALYGAVVESGWERIEAGAPQVYRETWMLSRNDE